MTHNTSKTRDNTTQRKYNTAQHETTRDNTTQHEYDTTKHEATRVQHEYNMTNTSIIRPNRSTKEALAAKIGLYIALFVTELYIFLISFRIS